MSAFVKAAGDALHLVPAVNAVIDGDEIVYRDYTDISIAVATAKGLVVPVLRSVDGMSFADVEKVRLPYVLPLSSPDSQQQQPSTFSLPSRVAAAKTSSSL